MNKISLDVFREYIDQKSITTDSYTRMDLDEIYPKIMSRFSRVILFGRQDLGDDSIEAKIQMASDLLMNMSGALTINPIFSLAPWLFIKFPSLLPHLVKLFAIMDEQKKRIADYIKIRETQPADGSSTMDKIIAHNRACVKDNNMTDYMDTESIYGTLNLISFASQDTSQNNTKMNICLLAERPDLRELMDKICDEIYDSEGQTDAQKVDDHEMLEQYFKESTRLANTPMGLFAREALRDITLKDINIRKGDTVNCVFASLNLDPNVFTDPNTFDIDRFSKENEKKYQRQQMMPFGMGKRGCIGRSLGQLTVKLFVTSFCRMFDFKKPDDVEYYDIFRFVRRAKYPFVDVKLKAKLSPARAN